MFSVYGRSRPIAKRKVSKMMLDIFSDISKELKKYQNDSQLKKQLLVDIYVQDEFKSMGLKRCTHEFSTPEFCKEAFEMMKKDTFNFAEIVLMKKINKTNGAISKRTGRHQMEWVEM